MNAVVFLTVGFVSVAVIGTLAAALHDAAAALLRRRAGLQGRDPFAGSSSVRVLPTASRAMTNACRQRASLPGAVSTGPVRVRSRAPTGTAGRLGA